MNDEPSTRRVVIEIAIFVLLFLIVGGAFVGLRVLREGPRVLQFDGRRAR